MMSLGMGAAGSRAAARAMAVYLTERQLADAALRTTDHYARTSEAEAAIAAGLGCLPVPRADMAPQVARALGIDPSKPLDLDAFTHLLSGLRADGAELEGHARGVGTYEAREGGDTPVRQEVGHLDLTLSASKSVSVAWALAETDAERASILQAHRTAVAETMAYVEDQVAWARSGAGGKGPRERGKLAWVSCQHYTARPTVERVCTDPRTGQDYTELRSLTVTGDPQLHTHSIVPNVVVTESGRVAALDTRLLHGRLHEFGAVYQALLARELRAMGAHVALDERTKLAYLPAIPQAVCDAYSKRNHDAEDAARERAATQGRDYDALTPDERSTLLSYGSASSRRDKETNTPDFRAWREQAARMGYEHAGITAYGPPPPPRTEAERMAAADAAGLPHLAEMLSKDAVIGQGDARLAAARGFIAEGIGADAARDMGRMMRAWAEAGVVQDGRWTKLVWQDGDRGQVRLTTELHRDQEAELIRLARSAAADRSHALTPREVRAGIARSGVVYEGEHGATQHRAVEMLAADGGLAVLVGVAGSGKTKGVLPALVEAWKARGLDVWGTGQRWETARELEGGGIDRFRTRALSVLLDGVEKGRTELTRDTVVVLDELGQVGTREMLRLLRLRERIGFKLVATGDDKQCAAIEAGPVVDLLRRALGADRIPEILTTVRQSTEQERRVAGLWREGKAAEALAAKREAGTAEMVPGGYRDAVRRVAGLYAERRRATHNQPDYRITISAPTNADAREIGREVRRVRREMGEITGQDHRVSATDGRGDAYTLDLAAGDRVRLYARTRGTAVCQDGRRRGVVVGNNGGVLRVLAVLPAEGLKVETANGTEAFVPWTALREKGGGDRLLLGHGDCLTIDSSQGITSDEHINALVAGSRGATGFKAYVAESRHRVRSWLVLNEGAELREVREHGRDAVWPGTVGTPPASREKAREAAWDNAARNLARQPAKQSALAFLERAAAGRRESVKLYQGVRRRQEARQAAGHPRSTLRAKAQERLIRSAVPRVAQALSEAAEQRAAVAASLQALWEYCESKLDRRVEAAARMVARGDVGHGEAVARVMVLEWEDQKRGHAVNPLTGLPQRPLTMLQSMEDDYALERRIGDKLDAAMDRLEAGERHAAERTTARSVESRAASLSA